jgi:hypothetical protein
VRCRIIRSGTSMPFILGIPWIATWREIGAIGRVDGKYRNG